MDETGLFEQPIELGPTRGGHFRAQRIAALREIALPIRFVLVAEDGADEHLGHLEGVVVGDVVAGHEAVADFVQIGLQRRRDAFHRQQIVENARRGRPRTLSAVMP